MPLEYPPTIIIRHSKEKKHKCTIVPLKSRDDFFFRLHPVKRWPDLDNYVRLSAAGPPLTKEDANRGLLLLDSSWRRVKGMLHGIEHLPTRSLHGYESAFPRASKLGTDPEHGLASVEAIYLAYRILGRPAEGLLDHYHWAEEFLALNGLS